MLKEGAWRSLRQLKARGANTPEFVLDAVREQAEAAEAKWRAAKPSAPLDLRHTRAFAKLDKAVNILHRNQRELEEFEAEVLVKRGRLEKRAIEDKERVALHQRTLDNLRREMDGGTDGEDIITVSTDQSVSMAVAGLGDVVPALQSILAILPADFQHRKLLEKAQADTEGVAAMLQNRRVPRPKREAPESFDLAELDEEGYEGYEDYDDMDDEVPGAFGDEWADQAGPSAAQAQRSSGTTRWKQSGDKSWGNGQQRDGNDNSPSTNPPAPAPCPAQPHPTTFPTHPQTNPTAPLAPATAPPAATAHREQIGLDGNQKLALAANLIPEDQAKAMALLASTTAMAEQQQQLHQQQQQLQQQQAQSRAHEAAVRDTVQRAKDKGIPVDQEWLLSLSTQDLGAWVYSNLG